MKKSAIEKHFLRTLLVRKMVLRAMRGGNPWLLN